MTLFVRVDVKGYPYIGVLINIFFYQEHGASVWKRVRVRAERMAPDWNVKTVVKEIV